MPWAPSGKQQLPPHVVIKLVPCSAFLLQRKKLVPRSEASCSSATLREGKPATKHTEPVPCRREYPSWGSFWASSFGGRLDSPYMMPVAGDPRYCRVFLGFDLL